MLLIMAFLAICVFVWFGTNCAIAVDLARRFRPKTLYLALIALFLAIGFRWESDSTSWCLFGLQLSCLILPPARLMLHFFCRKEGYEIRNKTYRFLVFAATVPLVLALLGNVLVLFSGLFAH